MDHADESGGKNLLKKRNIPRSRKIYDQFSSGSRNSGFNELINNHRFNGYCFGHGDRYRLQCERPFVNLCSERQLSLPLEMDVFFEYPSFPFFRAA